MNLEETNEEFQASETEKRMFNRFDQFSIQYIENWSLIFVITLNISFLFVFLACFLRPDFLNVCILFFLL